MANTDIKKLRAQQAAKLQQRMRPSARRSDWAEGGGSSPSERYSHRPNDTVIVKLRTTTAATRRVSAALRASEVGGAPAVQPFLATLIENGYAERISPVFPNPIVQPTVRGSLRAMSTAMREEQPVSAARGLVSIKVDPRASANQLVAHLNSLGNEIEYAYVPPVKYPFVARAASKAAKKRASKKRPRNTNDPLGSRQWGHGAIRIREARAKAGFKEAMQIIIAVIDSGIDKTHPDLDGSIHSYINFLSSTEDDRDYQGHGTHVAGIIAAELNNRIGIAGVCAARIMALKALPRNGNPWNAEAYYRALAHPITAGAKVVNLSLGGGFDPGEKDIITDLVDAGITVVAAMGNEFEEGNPVSYPAAYGNVIAVGATDEVDRRASFSCTGAHINLVAPGVNILSTTPQYPSELASEVLYDSWPGTSMATPHVAAAVALLLAKKPTLNPSEIRDQLTKTADRVPWQSARPDEEYGYGRLNVEAALK